MLKVRKNVFETNSSSIHAICISNKNVNLEDEYRTIRATVGEYGWEYKTLDVPQERLSYLYTAVYEITQDGNDKYNLDYIKDALSDIGITCIFEVPTSDYYYVDHVYELSEFLDAIYGSREALYNFIYSPESFVQTGNDNDDGYVDMEDKIQEIANIDGNTVYYKYN